MRRPFSVSDSEQVGHNQAGQGQIVVWSHGLSDSTPINGFLHWYVLITQHILIHSQRTGMYSVWIMSLLLCIKKANVRIDFSIHAQYRHNVI